MMGNTLLLTPSQTQLLSPYDQSTPGPDDIDLLAPPVANLGGALYWPIPLSADEQRRLRLITMSHAHHLGDRPLVMQTKGGVLEFLRYRCPLPDNIAIDPARILESLISSAQGQLMGTALQRRMQGIDSESSAMDYLLAGIALQMDPESITAPHRNKAAGFDLASNRHCGRHASAVVDDLAEHLSREGRTSAALAKAGAYLLLSRSAPQFLIEGIPGNVKVGSLAWTNLTMAAIAIEAHTPGKVPGLTFAEVMSKAENARLVDPASTQRIQTAVLLDWAVANEIILKKNDDAYTDGQLETIRATFNQELDERLAATRILDKALPTRKDIALSLLIERFGDLGTLFEVKALHTDTYRGESGQTGFSGIHSLLDYAMMDLPNPRPLASTDARLPLEALNNNPTFGVREAFERQFTRAIVDKKAAVNTTIRHMICLLPREERKNFEFGKISFFQQGSFVSDGFFNHTPCPNEPGLLIKTELSGKFQAYEININKDTIERTTLHKAKQQESREANKYFTTRELVPLEAANELGREHALSESLVNNFNSARSRAIADAFVQHLDLDDPAIKELARGQTPMDDYYRPKPLGEFLLNLIPFRSAIVNFQKGNYGEAVFDLTVDVFGFLTAGVATAGKLIRIGRTVLSTGARALKTAQVIGVATIDVLNPVGGLGDLARLVGTGGLYLLSKGAKAVNRLRGAADRYDVLKAISKQYDAAATGTVKVFDQTVEGAAILKSGQWYSFDVDTMQPYGSPLDDFVIATQAVAGKVEHADFDDLGDLSYRMFGQFSVPESAIAGLSPNSRGLYIAVDGHVAHIRHTDKSGRTAIYEVKNVQRAQDGSIDAQIYHENRKTHLLLRNIEGDQWQRLGASGGGLEITALHLRIWQKLTPAQKEQITRSGFSQQYLLPRKTFQYYVKPDGELSAAGMLVLDRPADTPFNLPNATHVLEWQNMTQNARDEMTMGGFAGQYHFNTATLRSYVKADGRLGSAGEALLHKANGGSYKTLTGNHLEQWRKRFSEPGNAMTPTQFMQQHQFNPFIWKKHVKQDGSLTKMGLKRLGNAGENANPAVPAQQPDAQVIREIEVPGRVWKGKTRRITAEHLKLWEAMPQAEKQKLTREGFAARNNLPRKTFEYYVMPDGQFSETGLLVRYRPTDKAFNRTSATHVRDWQNKSQLERDTITTQGYCGLHYLHPETFAGYVQADGSLKPAGKSLLHRAAGGTYNPLTDEHLSEWHKRSLQQNNTLTAEEFVSQHAINPTAWQANVKVDGSLRAVALQRIKTASPPEVSNQLPGRTSIARKQRVIAEYLRDWEELPQAERRRLTRKGFAKQHNLSRKTFEYYVKPDGELSASGMLVRNRPADLPFNQPDETHILEWQNMSQQERDTMTLEGFAGHHHLYPNTFPNYVRVDGGLGPRGQFVMQKLTGLTYNDITNEHLRRWESNLTLVENKVTAMDFMHQNGLDPRQWISFVNIDGTLKETALRGFEGAGQSSMPRLEGRQPETNTPQKRPAQDSLESPQPKRPADAPERAEEVSGPSSDILPVAIKFELGTTSLLRPHKINNTLPILQHPVTGRSMTLEVEKEIEKIAITHWNGLLDDLANAKREVTRNQIITSVKKWLYEEGHHQSRFDETLSVFTDLEHGPDRGDSVWARRDIPQFEVLGPYAGKFHESEESLFQEIRKKGSRAVLTYLFGTRSGKRSVSALHTGNTLSLINTSQLGGFPAWKTNNVTAIAVGKNLTFYVALNDIKKGEELLVDYGLAYQPIPDIAIKPDPGP
ncbi:SET domain-containing protein-lysine N-methyltransferase [Pseudomonas sp. TNT2022 ID642]|uniref:SET domain-containing protein-lysine N-methyltransferase n=1 Tax=Pseudomonas sp. TNT2022 ID642 TaxID=2942632 RepID=UPI00235F238A|nr:SET domain-containing protein-lysine N-methyltransferase [Pseudomonas sp. TNT2022 ID642]MDD1000646.1 SET domain-containing protein [Pseudomonas sp. TNT2022 ID642]